MALALASLPTILALIQAGVPAVESLITWVASLRASATATAQWTPQMETDFLNAVISMASSKQWTPDAALPKA